MHREERGEVKMDSFSPPTQIPSSRRPVPRPALRPILLLPPLSTATYAGLELTGQAEARAWRAEPRARATLTRLELDLYRDLELSQLRRRAG